MTPVEEIYDRAGIEVTLSTDDLITKAQDYPQFQNLLKKKTTCPSTKSCFQICQSSTTVSKYEISGNFFVVSQCKKELSTVFLQIYL